MLKIRYIPNWHHQTTAITPIGAFGRSAAACGGLHGRCRSGREGGYLNQPSTLIFRVDGINIVGGIARGGFLMDTHNTKGTVLYDPKHENINNQDLMRKLHPMRNHFTLAFLLLLTCWACSFPTLPKNVPVSNAPPPPVISAPEAPPPPVTSTTTLTPSIFFSETMHQANGGDQYTPTTTDINGDVYLAWMDADRNLRLRKIPKEGSATSEKVLRTNMLDDRYHVRPSVAIDKSGFIHVAADMHNSPTWVYYRSTTPRSVGSFEAIYPPGEYITYPNFHKDLNGELYLTFRHKVRTGSNLWDPGSSAGAVMRYNSVSRTFTMLGGTAHGFQKTLVWTNNGGKFGHYQQPGVQLFFDSTGRLHLAATLINSPTDLTNEGNTHVLYAYSDDQGGTWNRVDGSPITSLPMGPDSMSVVATGPNNIVAVCWLGAFSPTAPVIGWTQGGQGHLRKWTGKDWQNIRPSEGTQKLMMDRKGRLVSYRPYLGLFVTDDQGATYQKFTFSPALEKPNYFVVDEEAFINHGIFQFQYSYDAENAPLKAARITL